MSSKKPVGLPRDEAGLLADEYRRRVFVLAQAAKRLADVDAEVAAKRVRVVPAALADLEHARRLLAGVGTPAVGLKAKPGKGDEGD